jgi:hypothetical protein
MPQHYVEKYLIRPSGEVATTLAAAKTKAKRLAARIGSATVADFRGKTLATYTRKEKNAGRFSIRKTKKRLRPIVRRWQSGYDSLEQFARRTKQVKRKNPTVYDSAGKAVGKFRRKAAKIVARVVGGTVGKPKPLKNPVTKRFKTKAAMLEYAATHGYKVKSIRKAK